MSKKTANSTVRPSNAPNLTQRPPRSPRSRLGGYSLLPRMLDKARATLAGTNGEFDAVADPGKQYYRELGVEQSWAFAMHPRALWAAFRGMGSRFNLAMTGGPTGQPNQRTDFDVTDCRSARRFFGVGDDTDIGFRVVLVIGTQ